MKNLLTFPMQIIPETTKDNAPVTEFINEAVAGGAESLLAYLFLLIPLILLILAAGIVLYLLSRPKKTKKNKF